MEPISVIIWTCVIVFIITATLTLLHITGLYELPNPDHGKVLFKALIVEIVVISVAAFGIYLNSQNSSAQKAQEKEKIEKEIKEPSTHPKDNPKPVTPAIYPGKDSDLISFVAWYGTGAFSYIGGSCKGCPDLEKYSGSGNFRPQVLIADPKYIKRLDFIRDEVSIETQTTESLKEGSNTLFSGIGHEIVKVDGSRNDFYGGMTSYCWSGIHQTCAANASNTAEMMKFVTYRLNKHSFKIRVTKSNNEVFIMDLPEVKY